MNRNRRIASAAAVAGLALLAATAGFTRSERQPEGEPPMQLPAGWTMEHMMACVEAGTPGEEHAWLAEGAGTWDGTGSMWMSPGAEAMPFDSVMTVTPILDGRYLRTEMTGEIPGMGPYHGMGIVGYDNVTRTFVGNWIDNHSTTIMQSQGSKSADDTLTWTHTYTCPINRKPTTMREVDRVNPDGTRSMAMYGTDPVSGKQYKLMEFTFTRR